MTCTTTIPSRWARAAQADPCRACHGTDWPREGRLCWDCRLRLDVLRAAVVNKWTAVPRDGQTQRALNYLHSAVADPADVNRWYALAVDAGG